MRSRREREALRVVIKRDEWEQLQARGADLGNASESDEPYGHAEPALRISAPNSLGGQVANGSERLEVLREVEHRKRQRHALDRISVLEPRETVTGWMVCAFPWKTTPREPAYTLSVIHELKNEYRAAKAYAGS